MDPVEWLGQAQHWVSYNTGSYNLPGYPHNYNFFSGFGSDLSEITLFFALLATILHQARIHNCEVHGCWRLGRHATAANHKVCRKHHPDSVLTAQGVLDAHREASDGG